MRKIFLRIIFTILPLPMIVSCSVKNNIQTERKDLAKTNLLESINGNIVLSAKSYNNLYDQLGPKNNNDVVAIALIANHKIYTEIINFDSGNSVFDILKKSQKFDFKTHNPGGNMGYWLGTYKFKNTNTWLHGTRTNKNYSDYYPLYFINHKFAQLGISNYHPEGREIFEITYDDK